MSFNMLFKIYMTGLLSMRQLDHMSMYSKQVLETRVLCMKSLFLMSIRIGIGILSDFVILRSEYFR